ncbi:hypothetical protein K458DRAFT_309620 [Lentithecium fluviatile CBS 122367]|uniref:Uncharacterized protein n=1 Tax=Lentithecium fluviatile CBS 122367 TaxID=1168545 RepID=A0A6G1ITG0_9PLEO|nr:hypothetical protein K458DRAFT_309620 [Lentithecium fluviatile CBS 122367]
MKLALLFASLAPVLLAAKCSSKVVTVTEVVRITCAADGKSCGPPGPATSSSSTAVVQHSTTSSFSIAPPPQQATNKQSLSTNAAVPQPPVNTSPINPKPSTSGNSGGPPAPTYNPLPEPAIFSSETPSIFNVLEGQSGMAVIINSCDYDLSLNSVGCGTGVQGQLIPAGETYTEPIRDCTNAGVALHATSKNHTKPVIVEYGAGPQDALKLTRPLSYDLSFLDCMVKETANLTGCAGWKEGHQCSGGVGSTVWSCLPEQYCDRTSYTVPEYGQTPENKDWRIKVAAPVASTDFTNGVVWELCAANRVN